MIDAMQLGGRLRTARERRSLSQQAVAGELGLPRTAVTNMESGNRAVSTLELTKLAAIYGYPAAFFLSAGEGPEEEDLSVVLHQVLPDMEHAPEVQTAVERLLDLCREGAVLRRMLGQTMEPSVPDYATRVTNVGDAIRQGEVVAQEERRRLGLGDAPIQNVAELISHQGIWTAAAELPDSLSGLFVNHPTIGLAILVNRGHGWLRRHFSCLHEYAHALFDRSETVTATRRENSSQLVEKRANAFAAAFLMPPGGIAGQLEQLDKGHPSRAAQIIFDVANNSTMEAEVRARTGSQAITCQDVAVMARHFDASFEAVVWRLKNLNHISADRAAALVRQKDIGNKYIKLLGSREPVEMGALPKISEQEIRGQLVRLAIEAYRQEDISRGRLIEIGVKLEIGKDDLVELAEATCSE